MVGPNRYLGFIMIVAERDERELHSFILNWISLYQLDMLLGSIIKVVIVFLASDPGRLLHSTRIVQDTYIHVIRYDLFPIYRIVISVLINGNYRLVFQA